MNFQTGLHGFGSDPGVTWHMIRNDNFGEVEVLFKPNEDLLRRIAHAIT